MEALLGQVAVGDAEWFSARAEGSGSVMGIREQMKESGQGPCATMMVSVDEVFHL